MSREDLERFRDRVTEDQSLRGPLRAARDLESLIELSVDLGRRNGYNFTPEEVREFMTEIEKTDQRSLTYPLDTDEQLAPVSLY